MYTRPVREQDRSAAIIVAAGASRRMQGRDKLWMPLAGRIILARTVDVFQASPLIESIVLVISAERLVQTVELCRKEQWHKVVAVIPGGPRIAKLLHLREEQISIKATTTDRLGFAGRNEGIACYAIVLIEQ